MGHADELADIFGVPTDGSNIDTDDDISDESQEGAYAAVIKSSEEIDFEEKAKAVNEAVNEAVAKTSKTDENETTNLSNEEASDEQSERQEKRDFESIITDAKNAAKNKSQSESNEEMESQKSDNLTSHESKSLSEDVSENGSKLEDHSSTDEQPSSKIENNKVLESKIKDDCPVNDEFSLLREADFLIDAPSPMFDKFYKMKQTTLQRHLPGGKRLPIDKWTQEMHDAYVSIRISLSDKDLIAERMQLIQQKRDRVVQIKSIINSQYFLWKRLIPMMHGQLARVIYEKPAAKQDGINYEHMRDMEEYYNELEGLFETSKDILSNLDAAYDSLSRQVTLTGILPSPDKYGSGQSQNKAKTVPIDDDDFDSLDDNSTVKALSSSSDKPKKSISGPQEVSF